MNTNPLVLNNGIPSTLALTGLSMNVSTAVFSNQQASGVGGGTLTAGSWQIDPLNTTETSQSWASLSGNQITLTAGTYYFNIAVPVFGIGHYQSRLYNVTDSITALLGQSDYSNASQVADSTSFINGVVTISSTKTFEIDVYGDTTVSDFGLGLYTTIGTNVYLRVSVSKYLTVSSSPTNNYASSYFINGNNWSVSSTLSYADFTHNSGTYTLTSRTSSGIALTAAGSNLPGITFTPTSSSSVYLITCAFCISSPAGGVDLLQLTDGTAVISQSSSNGNPTGNDYVLMRGIYAPGTSSPVTVKLQGAQALASTTTLAINTHDTLTPAMEWTVVQIA